jgi:hypothetical protein
LNALSRNKFQNDRLQFHQHLALCTIVKNCFIFPIQSYGLKEFEAFLKYPFKFLNLDGMMVDFKHLQHIKDGTPLDQTVIQYNEDDVKILPYIMSTLTSTKMKFLDMLASLRLKRETLEPAF